MRRAFRAIAASLLLVACGDDDGRAAPGIDAGEPDLGGTPRDGGLGSDGSVGDGTGDSGAAGACVFEERFDEDATTWPASWSIAGGVAVADVVGGRGRLVPVTSDYALARMFVPLVGCVDAEVTFRFEMTDGSSQGIGVYLRQNGGHLQRTEPPGSGYAVFIEAFRAPEGIGVWHELDGVERAIEPIEPLAIDPGVVYRARFRLTQTDASTTTLQARAWRDDESEPSSWQVERTDRTPSLQGRSGGLAIDAYSARTSGAAADLFVDDVVVTAMP
ncbi:MAG: hypothetical protein IT379_07865 [Deltaproteobacteria bacterium]|nr:hypothetical protein [Deltaproteobacteria bacterium]